MFKLIASFFFAICHKKYNFCCRNTLEKMSICICIASFAHKSPFESKIFHKGEGEPSLTPLLDCPRMMFSESKGPSIRKPHLDHAYTCEVTVLSYPPLNWFSEKYRTFLTSQRMNFCSMRYQNEVFTGDLKCLRSTISGYLGAIWCKQFLGIRYAQTDGRALLI